MLVSLKPRLGQFKSRHVGVYDTVCKRRYRVRHGHIRPYSRYVTMLRIVGCQVARC